VDISSIEQLFIYEAYAMEEAWEHETLNGMDDEVDSQAIEWQHELQVIHSGLLPGFASPSPTSDQVEQHAWQNMSRASVVQAKNVYGSDNVNTGQADKSIEDQALPLKRGRPCKAQRHKFRKFIDRLKNQVHEELEGFDAEAIQYPGFVAKDARTIARVKIMMARYQAQVIKGEMPDLDAKLFPRGSTPSVTDES